MSTPVCSLFLTALLALALAGCGERSDNHADHTDHDEVAAEDRAPR